MPVSHLKTGVYIYIRATGHSLQHGRNMMPVMCLPTNNWFDLVAEEDYGGDKPKKVRAPPREPKHKRSKNSQDDR